MKKGLGRGFGSLIPTNLIDETFDPTAQQDVKVSHLRDIAIDQVVPDPDQPRRFFDENALNELTESVREHGVVQPIVVTPKGDKYLIVAGERRWRAANRANLTEVPCIIRSMSDQNRLEISLIENLQRHDLNALETATAYQKLRDQFNMTLEEIGKSVQQALFEGRLNEGQARPLIGLPDDAAEDIMERAIREEWSARRIEQVVTLWKQAKSSPIENKRRPADMPHADAVESLSKRFGTGVKIRTNGRGAGQISIKFKDNLEFERIRELLEK